MSWADAVASMAVLDGLLAQRKLDGDVTICGPDSPEELQRIISQGKRLEGTLRRAKDGLYYIRSAYEKAGVPFAEDVPDEQAGA